MRSIFHFYYESASALLQHVFPQHAAKPQAKTDSIVNMTEKLSIYVGCLNWGCQHSYRLWP